VSKAADYNATYNKINAFKGELEFWYQNNIGFFTDLGIMFLTVWVILSPETKLPYTLFPSLPKLDKNSFFSSPATASLSV
jgi:hypothetical protein